MKNIDEKLRKFAESCNNMAKNEANNMENQINLTIKEDIRQEVEEYENSKRKEYERNIIKLEHNLNSKIVELNTNAKKIILLKKQEFQNDVKNEVINRINDFICKDEYKTYLLNNIDECLKKINDNNLENITIFITKRDKERFEMDIKQKFNCNILEIDNENIGGSVCKDEKKNIVVNNTILEELNNQIF